MTGASPAHRPGEPPAETSVCRWAARVGWGGGAAGGEAGGAFGGLLPVPVFYGLGVASVGGPLGLAALFVPATLLGASSSSGLIVLVGALLFGFPVIAWYRSLIRRA